MRSLWLNYHDVYSRPDPHLPWSAAMYHVSQQTFHEQLNAIRQSGVPVLRPQESRQPGPGRAMVITFDDGWAGTFENAVPLLAKYSMPAVVFVTRDFVGRKSFCDRGMLRDAAQAGIEIGVHGTTHRMLSARTEKEILDEFKLCKDFLEQTLSRPVRLASLPGGDLNKCIVDCARKAGLSSLCTSHPGINDSHTSSFALRRVAVRSATDVRTIERFCRLAVRREVFRWAIFEAPRRLLGMKNYSRLRRVMVDFRTRGRVPEIFEP
jgi:peptidoglycan/xylan/chitin deacetylase (PgdA/CDA1 family)